MHIFCLLLLSVTKQLHRINSGGVVFGAATFPVFSTQQLWYTGRRKEVGDMKHLDPEYLCLFHAITDAIEELERLKADLMAAQRRAEALYMERTD